MRPAALVILSQTTPVVRALVVPALLLAAAPVLAQDFDYGVANAAAMQQTIIQSTTNANIIRGMYDGGAHVGTSGIHVGRPGARARQQAIAGFAARASANRPAMRAAMQAHLARFDVARMYAGLAQPFGLRADDAADAVAAYTLLGWLIATGAADPTPAAVQGVRAQIALRLAANPNFIDPIMRSIVAEDLKLRFVTLHGGWQLARRDGKVRAYADSVARMFAQQTGSDPRALRLTPRGFVRA